MSTFVRAKDANENTQMNATHFNRQCPRADAFILANVTISQSGRLLARAPFDYIHLYWR